MLQHQPGLLSFQALAALVAHPALDGRVVLATLHNTQHLDELAVADMAVIVAALSRLDRVLVHTLADLQRLRSYGVSDNLTLLPHGVARSLPPVPPRTFESPDTDTPVIGCYGFFLPGKGIDTLIRAVALLQRRWPKLRLALVNAKYDAAVSGEEIARCRDLVEQLQLTGSVTFDTEFMAHGRSLELLAGCDVVALPYLPSKEASSAALRGALTAGVPVAVTPIALFDEAGDAVFRFEGMEEDAVAAGLELLLRDRSLRARLQDAAQYWIAGRQWPDVAHRLDGMITGLVRTRDLERTAQVRP